MKTIYEEISKQLQQQVPELKWIDLDKGQLKIIGKDDKPPLIYPCALISITLPRCKDLTDYTQDCEGVITVRLAFDPILHMRTSTGAPEDARENSLGPYDIIAGTYKALQGFGTKYFDPLSRTSQSEESHAKLFVYKQLFGTKFEDLTAER